MYGKETPNDHLAIKAAGNELKALTRFYGASRGLGLCVPLMSLVGTNLVLNTFFLCKINHFFF